jgi:hypothetical protein
MAAPEHPGDFLVAWFGAKALLHGADPYSLIGPGHIYDWPWRPLYPVTAMIVALPFNILSQNTASVTFVFLSAGVLAYGVTADGFYRLPMFASASFIIAAAAAQWTPLLTAGFLIPPLAFVFVAKPNIGLAFFVSANYNVRRVAVIGGLILLVASLVWMPTWPREWFENLKTGGTVPPILRTGGFVSLLALLRWRRPEARLIVAMSLVPQTGTWYELLPLFLVASTASESMILCILSGLAFSLQDNIIAPKNEIELNAQVGALMVATGYLPATIMVLRRQLRHAND